MSKLSAFFDKKKKKATKPAVTPELAQLGENPEEAAGDDAGEWNLEPQQDAGTTWAGTPASPAANGQGGGAAAAAADGPLGRSLRVSAVGAYEIESKKDKSWSTMKRLEEEQRRGLQELREQEARELLLQQQLEQGLDPQQLEASIEMQQQQQQQQEPSPPKEEENKPWVSARVRRALEGGPLRRTRAAPVPSFEDDPDLATAVQLISSKPQQQQQTKKQQQQQQQRKSPSEPQPDNSVSTSPSTKGDDQQQQQQQSSNSSSSSSGLSDSEGSAAAAAPAAFSFDIQKFISFSGLSGSGAPLDAELVRNKYEARPPWTVLAATHA